MNGLFEQHSAEIIQLLLWLFLTVGGAFIGVLVWLGLRVSGRLDEIGAQIGNTNVMLGSIEKDLREKIGVHETRLSVVEAWKETHEHNCNRRRVP